MNNSKSDNFDYTFKIILIGFYFLIGDSGVGKSNILSQYINNTFNVESKTTIGVQFANKNIEYNNKIIKLQVWDTAGQQRYRSMANAYYRGKIQQLGASGALIVYDITRISSFQNINKWMKELKLYSDENMTAIIIGNKSDLRHLRSVKAQQFALKNNLAFMQTSALQRTNIDQVFNMLLQRIYYLNINSQNKKKKDTNNLQIALKTQLSTQQQKKKCCSSN